MLSYIIRRLAWMIPTLLGILAINFFVIQLTPGGPVDQYIAQLNGMGAAYEARLGSDTGDAVGAADTGVGVERTGLTPTSAISPEVLAAVHRLYGFDQPIGERFWQTLKNYVTFDFGHSYFKASDVTDLIVAALPVSMSIGIGSTLLIYLLSIPLGILRALHRNARLDVYTGVLVVMTSAIPAFMLAVFLIIVFAGGSYFQWFPLRGLVSEDVVFTHLWQRVLDYLWHLALPMVALSLTGLAGLTLLTRNCFLDELTKQYVTLAKAKGLMTRQVLCRHVFRNAMLIVLSGLPRTFVGMFFASSILIETIFSLNGLGLLGFEATMQRDYPVMFASLWIFTLIGLLTNIVGDVAMHWVDPRIHFDRPVGASR